MTRRIAFACIALTCVLLVSSTAPAKAPTLEELREMNITGPLAAGQKRKIDEYVKEWCGSLTKAKTATAAAKARVALLTGYRMQSSVWYGMEYASAIVKHGSPILAGSDRPKQVQVSMVAVGIPQYTIQPMLEKMARHANPAARYWAARAYGAAARRILAHEQAARKMLATLTRLGLKDPNGAILRAVLLALNPHPEAKAEHAAALRKTADKVWLARSVDIQAGKVDVIYAYRQAVRYLRPADEKDDMKAVLQMLLDVLEAASFALKTAKEPEPAGPLILLVTAVEDRLGGLLNKQERPIQRTLGMTKKPLGMRAQMVRLVVNTEWKPLLKKLGITTRVKPLPPRRTTSKSTTTASAGK